MSRIIFPAGDLGEAKSYIKIMTGLTNVTFPNTPNNSALGELLNVKSKYVSVNSAASIGFSFASADGSSNSKVLLKDYWFLASVPSTQAMINSFSFAAGFRVGINIREYKAQLNVSLSALAVKAQTEGLSIDMEILRVGMPLGPNVPSSLSELSNFNVEKFGELKKWEGEVIKYVESHRSELTPLLVSASIDIQGERLLDDAPAVRYSLWRISKDKKTLKQSLAVLDSGDAPEVIASEVRAVYASVFDDPTMNIPGKPSENREPAPSQISFARNWLNKYKRL